MSDAMTPVERIVLAIFEAERIEALLAEAAMHNAALLVRARLTGMQDALAELPEEEDAPATPHPFAPIGAAVAEIDQRVASIAAARAEAEQPAADAAEASFLAKFDAVAEHAVSFGVDEDGNMVADLPDAEGEIRTVVLEAAPGPEPAPSPPEPAAPKRTPAPAPLTPEREALFRQLWGDLIRPMREVLDSLNALPGPQLTNVTRLYSIARALGLPSSRLEAADALRRERVQQAPPEPTMEQRRSHALALLREGHPQPVIVARSGMTAEAVRLLVREAEDNALALLRNGQLTTEEVVEQSALSPTRIIALREQVRKEPTAWRNRRAATRRGA